MIRKPISILIILIFTLELCKAQAFIKTSDLFPIHINKQGSGSLNIIQDSRVDSLISRYIIINKNIYRDYAYYGMKGFRIQIYGSSARNAREESNKVRAEFIIKFPDIISYQKYDPPGYFKIRVGDYRTKVEGTKSLLMIRKEFPDAIFVPDIINFPDLNNK
jgi:hypothetical protein